MFLLLAAAGAQTYKISTDPWIAWSPVWVAQEKGFWLKHGVSVQVVSFTGGDSRSAFVAGKVDFGLVMAGTAVGMQIGGEADVVVLAEIDWSHGGDKIFVKKGAKLADLKRKRIGIYEDSPAVLMFLAAKLAAEGLKPSDFEIVVIEDMESMASQFVAGRLACAVSYEPYVAQATKGGGCEIIATTADFPGVMPEVIAVHRKALAKMPPAHVEGVLRGWIEAVEWSKNPKNAKEFARICTTKAFPDEGVQERQIAEMLKNVRIHGPLDLRDRNLGQEGIRRFLVDCVAFACERSGRKDLPDAARMIDTRPLERVLSGVDAAAPSK
jgi:NitT/TauT family transport system substrate-binding protein